MLCANSASFGVLLREYRRAAGLTQEDLAERTGLSVRGISDLERGQRRAPHRETVELILDALGLAPEQRSLLLASVNRRRGPAAVVPRAEEGGWPVSLTSFVGRERDRAGLTALLLDPTVRLLTLSGPGGVGKTRLALALAGDCRAAFDNGAAYVPLALLRDPALIVSAIAEALGIHEVPGQAPFDTLRLALQRQRKLLLLETASACSTARTCSASCWPPAQD